MKTLNSPQQRGTPKSAHRHSSPQELAVLTRANHDMRSPLSVILGVFELLEDASSLTDGERRYLQLGMKAADELLALADGLRLFSAMERNLVTLEATPVDLAGMAREQLESALGARNVRVEPAASEAGVRALGDEGYLKVALGSLARHLANNLPKSEAPGRSTLAVAQRVDEQGMVALKVAPGDRDDLGSSSDDGATGSAGHDELGVVNGMRLIEQMGGRVAIRSAETCLQITLPAAQGPRRS